LASIENPGFKLRKVGSTDEAKAPPPAKSSLPPPRSIFDEMKTTKLKSTVEASEKIALSSSPDEQSNPASILAYAIMARRDNMSR